MRLLKVFLIHLRRPRTDDDRTDPMYEFGSFGCTGCHSHNLFHPRHAEDLNEARLAFVQGGHLGSRLVYLTPPISVRKWADRCEARWRPAEMPYKYAEAPILVCNDATSDFPLIEQFAQDTDCPTDVSGLSSRFRSCATQLPAVMAKEVISVYERHRSKKPPSALASAYYEALPYVTKINQDRKRTYRRLIRGLRAELDGTRIVSPCKKPAKRTQVSICRGLSRCRKSK